MLGIELQETRLIRPRCVKHQVAEAETDIVADPFDVLAGALQLFTALLALLEGLDVLVLDNVAEARLRVAYGARDRYRANKQTREHGRDTAASATG